MPNIRWRAGRLPPLGELGSGRLPPQFAQVHEFGSGLQCVVDPSGVRSYNFGPRFSVCLATPPALGLLSSHPQTRFVGPRDASARSQVLAHTARSR
jgi:hypothetical protein